MPPEELDAGKSVFRLGQSTHVHPQTLVQTLKLMSSKLGSWLSAPIKPKQAEAEILHAMLITLEIKQAPVLFGYKIEMSYGTTRSEE